MKLLFWKTLFRIICRWTGVAGAHFDFKENTKLADAYKAMCILILQRKETPCLCEKCYSMAKIIKIGRKFKVRCPFCENFTDYYRSKKRAVKVWNKKQKELRLKD